MWRLVGWVVSAVLIVGGGFMSFFLAVLLLTYKQDKWFGIATFSDLFTATVTVLLFVGLGLLMRRVLSKLDDEDKTRLTKTAK